MTMDNKEKNSNIERLLQAVESPESFDDEQLDAIMNSEDTQELYSLLSDIEAVNAVDHSPLPDVEAEWSNFARWRRKSRTMRRSGKLRKINSWSAYISVAAVIIFALFVAVPFMWDDTVGPDSAIASVEHNTDEPSAGTDEPLPHYGQSYSGRRDYRYHTPQTLHGSKQSPFDLFHIQAQGTMVGPRAPQRIFWSSDGLGSLDVLTPHLMSSETFFSIKFTPPELSTDKLNWNDFYKRILLDW